MRVPSIRFKVRGMMLGVLVIAATTSVGLALLRRPYPVSVGLVPTGVQSAEPGYVETEFVQKWSDGRIQTGGVAEPRVRGHRHYGPLIRIEWSDGSIGDRLSQDVASRSYHCPSSCVAHPSEESLALFFVPLLRHGQLYRSLRPAEPF
jgi:hypothetical protein